MSKLKKVLVIGVGSIGERHLRCFQQTGRAEVGICELNNSLRESVARDYKVKSVFENLDSALNEKWDAAVICTPAHIHIPIAIQIAKKGIDLLIEKPLSTSLDGIDELIKTIDENQVIAVIAYVLRAHPLFNLFREVIQSERFGKPLHLAASSGQNFPFFRPAYRDIYYKDRATGGGAIQDALTHLINAMEWTVGPITSLTADASHQKLEGVEVEDTVNVITRHGQMLGSFSLNQYQDANELTVTVTCEKGTVRMEVHKSRWRWVDHPEKEWNDEPIEPVERDTGFIKQADLFLDAIEKSAPPLCTIEEAFQTLKVNLAILEASDKHIWKTIS